MSRAELRRAAKASKMSNKTYNMTAQQLKDMEDKIYRSAYDKAREDIMSHIDRLGDEMFKMMLVIPTNLLIEDYWKKSAKTRIPKFVDDCLSLYEAWTQGVVNMDEMVKLTEEYSGIKMVEKDTPTWRSLRRNGQM